MYDDNPLTELPKELDQLTKLGKWWLADRD